MQIRVHSIIQHLAAYPLEHYNRSLRLLERSYKKLLPKMKSWLGSGCPVQGISVLQEVRSDRSAHQQRRYKWNYHRTYISIGPFGIFAQTKAQKGYVLRVPAFRCLKIDHQNEAFLSRVCTGLYAASCLFLAFPRTLARCSLQIPVISSICSLVGLQPWPCL